MAKLKKDILTADITGQLILLGTGTSVGVPALVDLFSEVFIPAPADIHGLSAAIAALYAPPFDHLSYTAAQETLTCEIPLNGLRQGLGRGVTQLIVIPAL